jgi:anion-transporting  ArsA/GET3 family ATPase
MKHKKFEIFCGTGGVGKTTIATARAIDLASQGLDVLLLTIDPSHRLKQILHLDSARAGQLENVKLKHGKKALSFKAMLMSPTATLKRMAHEHNVWEDFENNIIKVLSRPHSGLNEILSVIEIQHHCTNGNYDVIVLDTPPGKHFIDFLESCKKIQLFFEKDFMNIFHLLAKRFNYRNIGGKTTGLLAGFVSTSIRKMLTYLEKMTGAAFIEEFVEALIGVYKTKDSFIEGIELQKQLQNSSKSNWYLVTCVDHFKTQEMMDIDKSSKDLIHAENKLIVNKCLENRWNNWDRDHPQYNYSQPLIDLKESILKREQGLKKIARQNYKTVIEFEDVITTSPKDQVVNLASQWAQK